jgi:hypothetical protein
MRRREFLRSALATGLMGTPLVHLSDVLASADDALAPSGPTDLEHLQAVVEQRSYGYAGRAPTDVLADLIGDVADLTPLLQRHQPAAARSALTRALAQLCGMTAIVLHDCGSQREAYIWFTTASRAAKETDDHVLQAWVLARQAMVPLNFGSPQAAVELAERAHILAGSSPTAAAALSSAVLGRAYGMTERRDDAHAALRDAEQAENSLPESERRDTWFGHCEQKHHVHLSHALTALGDTGRAHESQAHALTLSAPTSTLTRTLLRLDAATCLHREGDTLGACQAATTALASAPARHRTGLTRSRALHLYRNIPARLRSTPPVREFAELLTV